jgi:hypothetical protein
MPGADKGHFSFVERFWTVFSQTRPTVRVSPLHFVALWRLGDYIGARFGTSLTRLWQNTAMPTAAAKLLNPRYRQIDSRNARFKTEMEPSIPARK